MKGLSSNRPELVVLKEYLDHDDHIVVLNGQRSIPQAIRKWVGVGAKLNLHKSPDADVLKEIVLKFQKRVVAGVATLLLKFKTHRGDPLHEEADIRTEMGHLKDQNDITWDDPNRTIYTISHGMTLTEPYINGRNHPEQKTNPRFHTKTSVWNSTVRNRIRQKERELNLSVQ